MKKISVLLITIILTCAYLAGCGTSTNNTKDTIQVVCTIYPQYDWVRQMLGEDNEEAEVTLLVDNGIDFHSYQPSAEDIVAISSADLLIYVGGESDAWVSGVLENASNKDMKVINMMEVLGDTIREEELVEGMEEGHEHEDADEHENENAHNEEDEHGEAPEYDEHVWLSVKNAETICTEISAALKELLPKTEQTISTNTDAYLQQLEELDLAYQETVNGAEHKTVLVADRFPFRYLVDDYQLAYHAAFPGCSTETEASFETITFLSSKIDELGLSHVLVLEGSKHEIANTVISSTKDKNQDILVMDSIQSVTTDDISNGITYLKIMESNLSALKEALN